MGSTLLDKVWDVHRVRELSSGQTQLFIGLHLIHEVTSPQAFDMLRDRGVGVKHPEHTFATVDHIVPTDRVQRPFVDSLAEEMMTAIQKNTADFNSPLFDIDDRRQGVVHVIGPELGLTQPGMTIACGDSHTSTHGAFGAIAFGIGTSQVRDVLATQCLAMDRFKIRRINIEGVVQQGVYAKDIVLHVIGRLGVKGGVGYAYEYGGTAICSMTMEERMTVCNMSIEGGARVGYVNPDQVTFDYLRGLPYAPPEAQFDRATRWWETIASDPDAVYDDVVDIAASQIGPTVTWGITPGQSVGVGEALPQMEDFPARERSSIQEAFEYMDFKPGQKIAGTSIDVAFIGSCTNGRLSDLRQAAMVAEGNRVAAGIKAIVVPGSQKVRMAAEAEGLHEIFREAGFQWRGAGCSMCLAMNPDKLEGRQMCASSSNRNFKGRQGSPHGRTLLMSPAMVAAAAVHGAVVDVRPMLNFQGALNE